MLDCEEKKIIRPITATTNDVRELTVQLNLFDLYLYSKM